MRIAIVGASIAGLTLAARLDPSRCSVTLVESRPGHQEAGTALGLWPDLLPRLRQLLPGLDEDTVALPAGRLLRPSGRVVLRSPATRARLIPRPRLVQRLDAAVPAAVRRSTGRVLRGADLLRPELLPERPDLVVGADGVHSRIRPELLRRPWPARSFGIAAVRGVVAADLSGWISETWGRHRLFGITPHSPGRTNWFCAYPRADPIEDADAATVLAEVRERFADHHAGVRQVLDRLEPDGLLASTLQEVPAPPRQTGTLDVGTGRPVPAVLIGDAAHAMAPNLGRGAGEAMLDAFALAAAIETADYAPESLPAVLRAYARQRISRSQVTRVGSKVVLRTVLALP